MSRSEKKNTRSDWEEAKRSRVSIEESIKGNEGK